MLKMYFALCPFANTGDTLSQNLVTSYTLNKFNIHKSHNIQMMKVSLVLQVVSVPCASFHLMQELVFISYSV